MSQPRPAPAPWMCALVFAVTLAAYWPALHGELLWDDLGHVTRPELQSLGGLCRIWFEPGATQQYYPLLHSAFWLEHKLWGDATLGYHLVNLLLHATAACLFAAVLRRLTIAAVVPRLNGRGYPADVAASIKTRPFADSREGIAWLAALLFALHPVCVESVAWISEQKNTLSLVLYLCAALAYLRFDASAERDRPRSRGAYWLATALFAGALLTKTVTATLPAALLVVCWWQRDRLELRRDVAPLLPWFALSLLAGLTTAWFERTLIGADGSSFALGFLERGLLAGRVVWFYLGKLLWPADLVFIYPRWRVDVGELWQFLFPLAAIAAAFGLWATRRRGLLAAYLLFVGSLFPALGFVNVYPFLFSWVADHFQYLACLAVLATVAAGLAAVIARWPRWGRAGSVALLVGLGALTWRQSGTYRDPFTLFAATLEKNPDCWMAHNNLAEALTHAGRPAEAIPHLEKALKLKPDLAEAENNFGDNLRRLGRPAEAVPHLEKALRLRAAFPQAHNNLGIALMALDRNAEGIAHFEQALKLNPQFALARFNLGLALATTGRPAEAIPHFEQAVRLDPDYAEAELNWGIGLTLTHRFAEAEPHFERALQLDPSSAPAHVNYGRALATVGRYDDAVRQYNQALELAPTSADAHFNLALALRQMGRADEASAHYAEAQRLNAATAPGRE